MRKIKEEERTLLQEYNFEDLVKKEKNSEVKTKLLGLYHLKNGKSIQEVQKMILVKEARTIWRWLTCFIQNGYEGLKRKLGQGRKKRLPKEKMDNFRESVIELQEQRKGGRIRGHDIQNLLSEKYCVQYQKTAVYDLLKEVGLVWVSARSKHPVSNQEAQEAFKKKIC